MSLVGVWKSKDKREIRYIYVSRASDSYAFGQQCDSRGMALPGQREVRIQLAADGASLRRYERP